MRWMARMSGIGISRRRAYRRVCDFSILDGYVEIDADEDFFALEIEVCDREFVGDGHGGEGMDKAKAKRR